MGRGHGGSRGSAPANAGRGDATMRGYGSGLAKAMKAREDEIRGLRKENLSIFDESGNELFRNVGSGGRVQSNTEIEPNNIVTHNHPAFDSKGRRRIDNGGSLSRTDILNSARNNAKEIRAATETYTYSLKRPASGWNKSGWRGDKFIGNDAYNYRVAKERVDASDRAYYRAYKGDKTQAYRRMASTYAHRINKEFAKAVGYEYTKQRVN